MLRFYYKLLIILILSFGAMAANATPANSSGKKFTVVIDAGHGGKDIGATDNGVMEKNINLKVARQLESLIKKKLKNTKVVMTRDDDSYLTLQQRADKANKSQGDIFISIHTNSVDKKNKNRNSLAGSSVYTLGLHKDDNNLEVARRENSVIEIEKDYQKTYSGFDPQKDESYIIFEMAQKKNLSQSIRLAEDIEKELVASGRNDRGVHQAGFWVLWATSMPSVLVELDFICNPQSAQYLASDKGSKELAEAIFNAIKKYEATWRKNVASVGSRAGDSEDLVSQPVEVVELASGPAVKARTRIHKVNSVNSSTQNSNYNRTLSSNNNTPNKNRKNTQRRRRSLSSRNQSVNKSFESSDVTFTGNTSRSSVKEDDDLMASADLKPKVENDKGKDKKKLAKEEKKRLKEEKKNARKESKQRKANAHNAKVNKLVTVYKIQVLASADLLSQNNARFCGLSPISTYKENNLYKYYYGESTDKAELETILADVKKKIPDAFIVTSHKSMQKK